MEFRIGNGYDVHALAPGLDLWLGGVKVESPIGCIAHSDGDVAIHALCDARSEEHTSELQLTFQSPSRMPSSA